MPPPTKKQKTPASPANQPTRTVTTTTTIGWQGPLPPPGALQQFNDIIPDGAERIMRMCEQEQATRLTVEDRYSRAEVWTEVGGRAVGAILLLACIGAAIWSVVYGAPTVVTIGFIGVPLLGAIAKLFERKK